MPLSSKYTSGIDTNEVMTVLDVERKVCIYFRIYELYKTLLDDNYNRDAWENV